MSYMKNFRNLKFILLTIVLVFICTGCGTNTSSGTKSLSTPSAAQEEQSNTSGNNQTNLKDVMIIQFGNKTLEVKLNKGEAASQLVTALPQKITMSRWGDGEYYGKIPVKISSKEKTRDVFEVGEVAFWPSGNALCIFFGPTPASSGEQPKMASPGIPLGKIVSDVSVLKTLGATQEMALSMKSDTDTSKASSSNISKKTDAAGKLEITFPYVRQDGIGSNQFAVWIESADGKFIKTLFATQFTAEGGYKQRKEAIPTWVKQSRLAQATKDEVDAITGATPSTGKLKFTWDRANQDGKPVPAGDYKFFVEGTVSWDSRVLYTGTIATGNTRSTAEASAQYSTEEAKQSNMIGKVTATYVP